MSPYFEPLTTQNLNMLSRSRRVSAGVWRAIGVRGQSDLNTYRLKMVDPDIDEWLNSSTDEYTGIAGGQDHFGDIGHGFSNDFPNFFRIISQYYNIENIVSSNNRNAENSLAFNIMARLNRETLSIHYPEVGKLLEKWREIVKFKAHIFDKHDQLMGMVELDSINNLYSMQFRIRSDRFIPMHDKEILKINTILYIVCPDIYQLSGYLSLNVLPGRSIFSSNTRRIISAISFITKGFMASSLMPIFLMISLSILSL